MKNTGKIFALLGVVAGALGIYKYNKMTPEEKDALKDKAKKAGDKIKEVYEDVEGTVVEKIDELKGSVKKEVDEIKN